MSKHGTVLATKRSARKVLVAVMTIGVDLGDQRSYYCVQDERQGDYGRGLLPKDRRRSSEAL
jgi:hypothetical protein